MPSISHPPHRAGPFFASWNDYRLAWIGPDLIAGLTLAAIAIPEQMATARLGGLPPQLGFVAFIAATLAFTVFGSGRQMSVGADSTITPIFAGALALIVTSGSPQYLALAAGLSLMVGVLVAAAGVLRLGWIGNLLSVPVTTGFLAGIAIHIAISQIPAALGLPAAHGEAVQRIFALAVGLPATNAFTAAIAVGTFTVVAFSHRLGPRLPGALVAMVLATVATAAFNLQARGVAVLGRVSQGLPGLRLPAADLVTFFHLLSLALLVACIVIMQTAAVARAFPPKDGQPDINGDLIGVGAGNLLAGLWGAFPVNASPPRTAIAVESGGRSQLAGLTAVIVIAILLVAGTGLLTHVPQAALAAVLLFVAVRIVRIGDMRAILAASRVEALLVAATAAALVLLPIAQGVAVGIGLSLLQGSWSNARMRVRTMHQIPGTTIWGSDIVANPSATLSEMVVFNFQAPLNFLNADGFRDQVLMTIEGRCPGLKVAILEAAGILDVDFTAAAVLKKVIQRCAELNVVFAVARLESVTAQQAFERLGINDALGEGRLFNSVDSAVRTLTTARA